MKLQEGKHKFIQAWGSLSSQWGISKSMGQIHALLLSNPEGLSTEEIMEEIKLSRGNVNTNVRELMTWRLVTKFNKLGERKDFYSATSDVWTMTQYILEERQRREVEPVHRLLKELKSASIEGDKDEVKQFKALIADLEDLVSQLNNLAGIMSKINNNNFLKKMIKAVS